MHPQLGCSILHSDMCDSELTMSPKSVTPHTGHTICVTLSSFCTESPPVIARLFSYKSEPMKLRRFDSTVVVLPSVTIDCEKPALLDARLLLDVIGGECSGVRVGIRG